MIKLHINRPTNPNHILHDPLKFLRRRTTQSAFRRNAKLRRYLLRLCDPRFRPFQISGVDET
jgi:hypothetical protein